LKTGINIATENHPKEITFNFLESRVTTLEPRDFMQWKWHWRHLNYSPEIASGNGP